MLRKARWIVSAICKQVSGECGVMENTLEEITA